MTDDIFQGDPQQDTENVEVSFEQRIAQQLAAIKREDGSQMFDSVEKALESLMHAQEIIPKLKTNLQAKEQEVEQLSSQLEKAATVEDVISRINSSTEDTNVNARVEQVNEDTIGKLVKEELENFRKSEEIQNNRKQVNDALVAKFGDAESAKLALEAKAAELGVGPEFLSSLAEKSPKALLAYFNQTSNQGVTPPNYTSVNLRKDNVPHNDIVVEKFSLSTTSSSDQIAKMRKIREAVYKKHGVEA